MLCADPPFRVDFSWVRVSVERSESTNCTPSDRLPSLVLLPNGCIRHKRNERYNKSCWTRPLKEQNFWYFAFSKSSFSIFYFAGEANLTPSNETSKSFTTMNMKWFQIVTQNLLSNRKILNSNFGIPILPLPSFPIQLLEDVRSSNHLPRCLYKFPPCSVEDTDFVFLMRIQLALVYNGITG